MPTITDHSNNQVIYLSGTPNLAISGTSALVKYAYTFIFRANGRYSPATTTANCPSLALATLLKPYPSGTAPVVAVLPSDAGSTDTGILSCQYFTLVATLPEVGSYSGTTDTPTFSWLAGAPFNKFRQPQTGDKAMPNQSNQCAIGFVLIKNASGSDFTPGTTVLTAVTVTYEDNYSIAGS